MMPEDIKHALQSDTQETMPTWNPHGFHMGQSAECPHECQWFLSVVSHGKPVGNDVEMMWKPCGN